MRLDALVGLCVALLRDAAILAWKTAALLGVVYLILLGWRSLVVLSAFVSPF